MKKLFICLFIIISTFGFGQSKSLLKKEFVLNSDPWPAKEWGYYSIPTDKTKKFPVIIFFHGTGEVGKGEPGLVKLDNQGFIPYADSLKKDFALLAMQSDNWSVNVAHAIYVVDNDPEFKGRISEIVLTGFSAGASNIINYVIASAENAKRIRAVIPISSPDVDRSKFKNAFGVKGLIFGTDDGYASGSMAREFAASIGGTYSDEPLSHESYSIYKKPELYQWIRAQVTSVVITPVIPKIILTITIDGKTYTVLDNKTWY